jgi:hypothetical protein
MTKYDRAILIITVWCISISGCKLDQPVTPPTENPASDNTVLGITVVGKVINDNYLTGEWKAVRTAQQYYDSLYILISGTGIPGKFTSVALDDKAKTFKYTGLPTTVGAATGSYGLSTSENVLFIGLTTNPFFVNPKSQVRITSLSANSMTWIAMDTTLINYNNWRVRQAYEIIFTK